MEIREYKCPNCGGQVKFDSSIQRMKCPYCDTEFAIGALDESRRGAGPSPAGEAGAWEPGEGADGLSTGACPSCGAELVFGKDTVASVCPCCGNAQIARKRIQGFLKPDWVIPFKLEKKAAVAALLDFYKGKPLLPDLFKEENRVNSIQGMYVPFWLFDAKARGRIGYKATKKRTWSDSSYVYAETTYYSVARDGNLRFERIPVDGSDKMDDSYMDALEPFDYGGLKDFEPSYLAGYSAEKYDMESDACKGRAGARISATLEEQFRGTVLGYDTVLKESSSINIDYAKAQYALLPVWILNTKYKKENYLFMMNGQSGRIVGRLPADTGKFWKFLFLIAGISGAALTLCAHALKLFL